MIFLMDSMWETVSKNYRRMVGERPELKATAIAEAAGVTRDMVYKWNKGENIPDVDKIDKLAGFFRVQPIDFYKGAENVLPFYGNSPMRKYLVIPDEVVTGFYEMAGDKVLEEQVKAAILLRRKEIQDAKQGKG